MYLLQLALIPLLISIFPLSYIWVSRRKDGQQNRIAKLIAVALFLTFDLIIVGSFTRLTDSGLGCPDWPGCYGTASPFSAHAQIHAAQQMMPTGPVTWTKAWIEMVHRYFAMTVGILVITLTVIAWRLHARNTSTLTSTLNISALTSTANTSALNISTTNTSAKTFSLSTSPWLPTNIFFLIVIQGLFGALTVTQKLQPLIVTVHLLLGLLLLCSLAWLLLKQTKTFSENFQTQTTPYKKFVVMGLVLLVMQIMLGGWVSTNYAVLACTEFPQCQGVWLPTMNFEQGFTLWRALGYTHTGAPLDINALVAIHWTHRTFAYIVALYLFSLALYLYKVKPLRKWAGLLAAMLMLQLMTGIANIIFKWPLLIALLHSAGAAVLLLLMVTLLFHTSSSKTLT